MVFTRKEIHKRYRDKNREKLREFARDYYHKNKEKICAQHLKYRMLVLIHYGGNPPKCACCDEDEVRFLTIDHIDDDGEKDRKKIGAGYVFYRWLIENNYPEGFQVLCWNCNCGKRMNSGICPHKKGD